MEEGIDIEDNEEVRRIRKISSLKRENRRLRNSVSFQLGLHLTESIRKPWRLLILPVSFPLLCLKIGLRRLGKITHSTNGLRLDYEVQPRKNAMVLFPTNGVGFGHFTRLLSVAKRLKRKDPSLEIVFFTTMSTIHLLKEHGIIGYRIPGRKEYSDKSSTLLLS